MCNTDSISHSTWVFLDTEMDQAIVIYEIPMRSSLSKTLSST